MNFKKTVLCTVLWYDCITHGCLKDTRLLNCYHFWCSFYCFYHIDFDRFICFVFIHLYLF